MAKKLSPEQIKEAFQSLEFEQQIETYKEIQAILTQLKIDDKVVKAKLETRIQTLESLDLSNGK